MNPQTRLNGAISRLATGTNVLRSRTRDKERAARDSANDEGLDAAILKFESAADNLWEAIDLMDAKPLRKVA